MRRTTIGQVIGLAIIAGAALTSGCTGTFCEEYPEACGTGGGGQGGSTTTTTSSGGNGPGSGGNGGEGGGIPVDCDPLALAAGTVVPATCGLFVDAASTAVAESGTQAAPYKTLAAALGAASPNQPVYVCTSPLDEAALVEADARLYGGLDCATWQTGAAAARTPWTAPAGEVPLAVRGAGVSATVAGFAVTARDATGTEANGQGKSSIAAWVDAATLRLERAELVAGSGAQGAPGEAPPAASAQAANGTAGANGCIDASAKAGGNPGQNTCEDPLGNMVNVNGGAGGTGTNSSEGGNGSAGQPAGQGGTAGAGQVNATVCTAGGVGTQGNPAPPATFPASHPGMLDATGYVGPAPVEGPRGAPGTGGGGGGGARQCASNATFAGPGGGGGGAGGCGGLGGKGGSPGGASIALLAVEAATVDMADVRLESNQGGQGGQGALGQAGQQGGFMGSPALSGAPGTNDGDGDAFACNGGGGGRGGNGGPGAGGAGGASALLARALGVTVTRTGSADADSLGSAGAAGPAAAGGNPGVTGLACATLDGPTWACAD